MNRETKEESILKTNFVTNDFFVARIKGFEEKYEMQWEQFLAEYTAGTLQDGRCNPEFAEWSLLCHSFMSELLKPDESPPVEKSTAENEKSPSATRAFSFLRGGFVRSPGLFRSDREDTANASRSIYRRDGWGERRERLGDLEVHLLGRNDNVLHRASVARFGIVQ
jgi:hypothetical protein